MKKPKTYNLSKDVIAAINSKALADDRKDSDWLNRYLTKAFKLNDKPKQSIATNDEAVQAYPSNLNLDAWGKWLAFRKVAKFKSYKSSAPEKKLAKMGTPDEQMLIVQQSIDNEYQGLFPLKGNGNGHQNKATNAKANIKESSHERIKRENDIKYRGSNECGLGVGEANGDMGRAMDKGQRVETVIGLDNEPFIDY